MQEFEQKILEQYDIEVSSTRKVRGAVLCETNKGLFLLKEITTSEKRIPALCELYTRLYEQGYHRIDYVVTNRNGEYISALDNGDRYILKNGSNTHYGNMGACACRYLRRQGRNKDTDAEHHRPAI